MTGQYRATTPMRTATSTARSVLSADGRQGALLEQQRLHVARHPRDRRDRSRERRLFAADVDDVLGAETIKAVSVLYHAVGTGDVGTDAWTRIGTRPRSIGGDPLAGYRWRRHRRRWGRARVPRGRRRRRWQYRVRHPQGRVLCRRRATARAAERYGECRRSPSASGWYPSASVELAGDGRTFEYSLDDGEWQAYDPACSSNRRRHALLRLSHQRRRDGRSDRAHRHDCADRRDFHAGARGELSAGCGRARRLHVRRQWRGCRILRRDLCRWSGN